MRLGGATNDIRRQLFLSYINGAVINNQIILNQKKNKKEREKRERVDCITCISIWETRVV